MKCLQKYNWVKLPRNALPIGKGLMGAWMRLASRAAFRKGMASYCGYENAVEPGMWAGGIVGLKSILGVMSRAKALETLDKLSQLGYLAYELDKETKKLTYQITDWVVKCSGKECMDGAVYTTDGYGFLCLSRNITPCSFCRVIVHWSGPWSVSRRPSLRSWTSPSRIWTSFWSRWICSLPWATANWRTSWKGQGNPGYCWTG